MAGDSRRGKVRHAAVAPCVSRAIAPVLILPAGACPSTPGALPMPATVTSRRAFMLGSGALFAGLMLPRSSLAAAPASSPYWDSADRLQALFDARWASGMYQPARAMVN